ncbi:hypothetical protein [uncultured Mediterranean phage uvMED]|nr:hypothetical protein [uncultured Mediterranean phage uvMED]
MADISQLVISVDSKGVVTATGNLDLLNKSGKKTQKTTETLDQSVKKLTKQFERQARNAGKSANEIKILDLKAKGATDAQLKAAQAAMKNAEAMKQQADAARFASMSAGETNGAFRAMRGSTQQLSWQLQDVAVQAQMGTDAFMILGQQGPQIASIFGSGGAVLGALIAFGSILAGAVVKSITGTGDAMKKLKEINEGLIDSFDDLTDAQKEYARSLVAEEIKNNKQAISDLEKAQDRGTKTVLRGNFAYTEFSETAETYSKRLEKNKSDVESLKNENIQLANSVDDLTNDTERLVLKLGEELATLNLTEEQLFAYQLAMSGATKEQIALGVATFNKLQKDKEAIEVAKNAEAALKKQAEETATYSEGLYHQLAALTLSGDALFYYQAALKGGTAEQIASNVELLKAIDARKEEVKAIQEQEKAVTKLQNSVRQSVQKAIQEKQKENEDAKKAEEDAKKRATKAAQRGLDRITLLALQHEAERVQLADDLAKTLITQQEHDEALKGQARETAAALADIDRKSAEEKQKIADAKSQIDAQLLSSASALVGQLANIAEEGSTEAKVLFGIQKAIAIATTVMNAEVAAIKALATIPPPANVGYSNAIRAMGYASAGIIAGTAIAGGRALGGQVRGGESYLVGERGPELLTMGTSGRVTSNDSLKNAITNNSGSDVVINQSINITTGVQSTVRAEIITLMPQIAQAAKGAVADARLRGGNFSKAMSGA